MAFCSLVDFLKNSAWALHDDVVAIHVSEPVVSYSVVAPVNVTDLDSPNYEADLSVFYDFEH